MTEDHTSDAAENAEGQAEDAPLNRAERRAKGKKAAPQAQGKNAFVPKSSGGGSPRIWSNRRAG